MTADLLVVGSGLIGTSLGLAVPDGWQVLLADRSTEVVAAACARGAGRPWDGASPARLAVVCVPVGAVAPVVRDLLAAGVARTLTHVGSVQAAVQEQLAELGCDPAPVCGGHPMAGRERGGPGAATADLFAGRPWVLCPSPSTGAVALQDVTDLAAAVGAEPVVMDPQAHDAAVALVSHLPQVAASALAARLVGGATALAGPGLQDSTRVAASDPSLWRDVLRLNAGNLAPLVRALADDLAVAAAALEALAAGVGDPAPLEDLMRRGAAGRGLVPVKRGERDAAFVTVAVAVTDRPGQLAALLGAAGDGGVNVEDVRVDHVPGRPRGVIGLLVREQARPQAEAVLRGAGWDVLQR